MSTEQQICKAIADQKAISGIVWTNRQAANYLYYVGAISAREYIRVTS